MTKVDICLKDNRSYCDVAYLVDRDDFQVDLETTRQKFFTDLGVIPDRNTGEWRGQLFQTFNPEISEKCRKMSGVLEKKILDLDYIHTLDIDSKQKLINELFSAEKQINAQNDFDFTIMDIRAKHRRYGYFNKVIESAVAYGNVQEEDYIPYEVKWIHPETEYPQLYKQSELVISINPNTRVNDLKRALQKASSMMNEYPQYGLISPNEYFVKAKPQIRMHRDAYWLRKLNPEMSYLQISNYFDKHDIQGMEDPDVIQKAIKAYRDWLNQ